MSIGSWLALPSELPESPLRVTRPMQRLCGSAGALSPLPLPSPLPGGVGAVPAACVVPATGVPVPSLLLSLFPTA